MGYAIMIGECLRCARTFGFNPHKVPSLKLTPDSPKEPICEDCFNTLNQMRIKAGADPWPPPLQGAYEALPEEEL